MQNKKLQSKKQNGDLANNITVYQIMRFNEDTQAYKTLSVELSENNKVMLRLTTGISGDKESRQSIVITLTLSELTEIAEICRFLYNHIKSDEIANLLNKRDADMKKQKTMNNRYEERYDDEEEENIKLKKQNAKSIKSKQQYNENDEEEENEIPVKKKQKFNKASKIQSEYEDSEDMSDEYEDEE